MTTTSSSESGSAQSPPGLAQVCVNTQHQPIVEQGAASGIWVRGEVYGLEGGWIYVEGPTLNNGNPVQIDVNGGRFEGPLGINSYGDHEVTRFELQSSDPTVPPVNLLPTLNEGPGTVFPVDSNEGPIFDDECFGFDPAAADTAAPAQPSDNGDTGADRAQELNEARTEVEAFLEGFVEDHTTGDTAGLLDTLHPAVPLAFGEAECSEYVTGTTGSITGATLLGVELPRSIDMDTPNGPITFPEATPFSVEFQLLDGTTVVNDANLAAHDGAAHWLTRCGVGG